MSNEGQAIGVTDHIGTPPPKASWRRGPGAGLARAMRKLASGEATWVDLREYPDDRKKVKNAYCAAYAAARRESIWISIYRSVDNRMVAVMVGKREDAGQ